VTNEERMAFLGTASLLADCSVMVKNTSECSAVEMRAAIEDCFNDLKRLKIIGGHRRILNRFEIITIGEMQDASQVP
jgi:hypothetical protein